MATEKAVAEEGGGRMRKERTESLRWLSADGGSCNSCSSSQLILGLNTNKVFANDFCFLAFCADFFSIILGFITDVMMMYISS